MLIHFHMFANTTKRRKSERGLTLIESIVGVGILVLLLGAVILFHRTVIMSTQIAQTNLTIHQQVRRTLSTLTLELRAAKPSASGSYPIESAGTSSIVFYSDIDATTDVERIRYYLATSTAGSSVYDTIRKGVIKPVGTTYPTANETTSVIARYVRNASSTPLFTYFNSNYAGTSSPLGLPVNIPSIRHVRMDIRVEERAGRGTTSRSYMTHVSVRQLKDNY
jgi:hypothetical protein